MKSTLGILKVQNLYLIITHLEALNVDFLENFSCEKIQKFTKPIFKGAETVKIADFHEWESGIKIAKFSHCELTLLN